MPGWPWRAVRTWPWARVVASAVAAISDGARAVGVRSSVLIGLGLAVSAATGEGAGGVGCTAEPLLVPLTIRATTTASTMIAAAIDDSAADPIRLGGFRPHRVQHGAHGPSLGSATGDRRQPRRRLVTVHVTAAAVGHCPRRQAITVMLVPSVPTSSGRILGWYATHARDLPWRRPDASPWSIMVSEFMLQQTPVERVRGPWQAWIDRWPTPASLAARTGRRGGARLGPAGLPAPRAPTAPGGDGDHRTLRRPGPRLIAHPCSAFPVWAATPRPRSPASPSGTGRSCWTPTSAGCWPGS